MQTHFSHISHIFSIPYGILRIKERLFEVAVIENDTIKNNVLTLELIEW